MATQTETVHRAPVQAERVHDYLYDHHYVVSSERDHARATFKAHTSTDRVKRVTNFQTMFSELRHHPRFQMRLDVTDPVPKFINRQWRGYNEHAREALIRYKTFNYDPSVRVPPKSFPGASVSGQDRYKFFRRPIIPFLQQVPPEVLLASSRQDPLAVGADQQALQERTSTPLTHTVEIQTDYRDSEAQTDPYTPEYVVRPGSQPELLTLATLSYGCGLPAGLAEVEMIERARAKRAWEATLPPLNDVDQLDKRKRMMDEMERKEWALREQEIEKMQEARLEVLKQLLKQREENHQELNTKRLDRLWAKKQRFKEEKVSKIRNDHIKTIRKLTEKRRRVEGKLQRRNVVSDYSDYASGVYAPMTRIGIFLDRGSEQHVVKSRYLSTYQGLLELENSLPDFVTAPRIKAPKPKTVTKSGFIKRKYRQERELAEIHEVIKDNRTRVQEPPKPLRFLQKIEKPIPRPPTPTVDVPPEEEENRELAIIFLQQIIRGRAIQNMMFEGKEKRIELIRELRSTHALQEAEREVKRQEKQATLALQRQRRLHDHKESFIDEAVSQMEGESLGDMLDFLSKELIRLQEERRIHAFSMLAERQRRIREAEESGRRQLEERRRREEDEIFKQVLSVNQDTVDTYLQDIILASMDNTADEQARSEIDVAAAAINDVAYEMEDNRTQLQSEEIVSELVHGFLLPEVQKINMREKVHRQQRQYLAAAHKEIHRDGEGVIAMYPKAGAAPDAPTATGATPIPIPQPMAEKLASKPSTPKTSRPSSAAEPTTPKASHPSSAVKLTTPKTSRPSSAAGPTTLKTSRPSSAAGATTPKTSRPSSAAGPTTPKTSRPSSAAGPTTPKTSRPSSAAESTTPKTSRPSSAVGPTTPKAGSRRGSGASISSRKSGAGTPEEKPSTPDLSITGSAPTSRPTSAQNTDQPKSASRPRSASRPTSRTITPSTKPPLSPATSRPSSSKLSRPGSARESPQPGSARESPKPDSASESPKPGSARESPKLGSARESPIPGSTRESPKPGSTRESPKPGSGRESPIPGSARESPKPGSARESPKPGSARESPKLDSARESPKPDSVRESPKPGSIRESPKPGSIRESPKPGSARESPKPASARESPKPGSARESPKPGSARESPKPGSARESPRLGLARESITPDSGRESSKPGSARESPKPGSARQSPKPGSARESPKSGLTADSPKPGSARESPKPGSTRESPKPGSARESPKPSDTVQQNSRPPSGAPRSRPTSASRPTSQTQ